MIDNLDDYLDFATRNAYLLGLLDSEQEGADVVTAVFEKLRRHQGEAWTNAPVCIKQNILWAIKSQVRKMARRERLCPSVSIESSMDENSDETLLDRINVPMRDLNLECPSHRLVLRETLALLLSSMNSDLEIFMVMADSQTKNNLIFAARKLKMNVHSVRTRVNSFRKMAREIVESGHSRPDVKGLKRSLRKQHDAALNGGPGPNKKH